MCTSTAARWKSYGRAREMRIAVTSSDSTIVSAYAYRQSFQCQVHAVSDQTIEQIANTLAGT